MNFRAVQVLCMTVTTLLDEIPWAPYGSHNQHTPIVQDEKDCRTLDLLTDVLGTLTRMMDTKINYVNNEGKIIREWIESIIEIGTRYQRELAILKKLEGGISLLEEDQPAEED